MLSDDQVTSAAVASPPSLPNDVTERCVVFIHDTNLHIEMQKYYARDLKVTQDPRYRVNVSKFLDIIVKGRDICPESTLYGSEPPPIDTVWKKMEPHIRVLKNRKNSQFKEKALDNALTADAVKFAVRHEKESSNITFIMVTGDRDCCPAVETVLSCGFKVELLAFKRSLSRELRTIANDRSEFCKVIELDDLLKGSGVIRCCFTDSKWKKGKLPRFRTKVLEFQKPFDETSTAQLRQLADEMTKMTGVPCFYRHTKYSNLVFIVGYLRNLRQVSNDQMKINEIQESLEQKIGVESTRVVMKELTYRKVLQSTHNETPAAWNAELKVEDIKGLCSKTCPDNQLIKCEDFCAYFTDNSTELNTQNKFTGLEITDDEEESDENGDEDSHETQTADATEIEAQSSGCISNEFHEDSESWNTSKEKSPKRRQLYSDQCEYHFCCTKGRKCPYQHTDQEICFFKSNGGRGCPRYKSEPCDHYQKGNCRYSVASVAPLCYKYHSIEESRCFNCNPKSGVVGHDESSKHDN